MPQRERVDRMSLRAKTTRAATWQFAARLSDRGLRFVASVVLARMLAPSDFGALAAVMAVAGMVEALTYVGVDQAIAQSTRSGDPRFLGAALRITAVRGFLLSLGIFLAAPLIDWYFERDDLTTLVRIVAASSLFAGLANPWVHSERKELRLAPLSISLLAAGLVQIFVSILGARMGFGALALAIGTLASSIASTITGWLLVPRRISLAYDVEASLELRAFAARAAGIPFLIALFVQMPAFVIGRAADLATLGVFTLAQRLTSLPSEIALPVFGTVLAPAYAHIREDRERLRRVWLLAVSGVALLVMPAVAAVAVLDGRVPTVVYGSEYAGPTGLVALLAIASWFSVIASSCGALFWGVGRPDLDRVAMLIRLAAMIAVGVPATARWGAVGFSAAFAVAHGVCAVASLLFALRMVGATTGDVIRTLLPSIGCGALVAMVSLLALRIAEGRGWTGPTPVVIVLAFAAWTMIVFAFRMRRASRG
jgi:PST family polysaccharide transporter